MPQTSLASLLDVPTAKLIHVLALVIDDLIAATDELTTTRKTIVEDYATAYRQAPEPSHSARDRYARTYTSKYEADRVELEGRVAILTEQKFFIQRLIDRTDSHRMDSRVNR